MKIKIFNHYDKFGDFMTVNYKRNNILLCPFLGSCILPQLETICRYPECKICSEYQSKEKFINKR